jgi:D-alanyl-D-alanine carboxypeptidase/D-alanyl-D-alanine-endopeptidase (penicillin-binding protein 4)
VLYAAAADRPVIPASTTKLLTAAAALTAMPPTARLVTRVVTGAGPRQVVLVGGGDPTLASRVPPGTYPVPATVGALAARTAAALRAAGISRPVRVGYDASAYAGRPLGPGWKSSYVGEGDVAPVTALEVDEGRARPDARPRVTDPATLAARDFVVALRRAGIRVTGDPVPAVAPAAARELARVESPPIGDLVERMLTDSDNDLAEALGRHLALDSGRPPTFAGAAEAVLATVRSAGLAPLDGVRLVDTSGLSRADRVTPAVLVDLVRAALDRARLRPILTGLPVAGLTGTLADRFRRGARSAAGAVRAKTGTLTQVSAVAGTTVDRSGQLLVFAFVANRVPSPDPTAAEAALDRVTAVLAGCGCG